MNSRRRMCTRNARMWAVVVGVLLTAEALHAATVTVNPSVVRQTIEGFGGACEGVQCPYICGDGKYPGSDQFQRYVADIAEMGCTMMRLHGGPDECDMGAREDNATWMQALQQAVRNAGDDDTVKFIYSTWTPRAQWKDNNSIYPGYCKTANYGDFADYLVQYYKDVEQLSGCKVYAANFANEPSFANPFWACLWTPAQYRTFLKDYFGPRMRAQLPHVKLMCADELESTTGFTILDGLAGDATARSFVDAVAIHYYQDWTPSALTTGATASHWTDVKDRASRLGNVPVYMSETSTYCDRWDGNQSCQTECCGTYTKSAFYYAYGMMAGLLWGRMTAWTNYGIWEQIETGRENSKAVMMQYSRHIRPGAVALETSATDNILALAFRHPRKGTSTIVMINLNTSAQTVTINWPDGPTSYQGYQSSATKRYVSMGTVNPSSVSMDPRSIVTLTSGGTGVAQRGAVALAPRRLDSAPEVLYTVLGSRVAGSGTRARGVYVTHARPGTVAVRPLVK